MGSLVTDPNISLKLIKQRRDSGSDQHDEVWLELLRLLDGKLVSVGASTTDNSITVVSKMLPLTLHLVKGEARPKIDVRHANGEKTWLV